jgi:mono/diheme cytochrome c family protein
MRNALIAALMVIVGGAVVGAELAPAWGRPRSAPTNAGSRQSADNVANHRALLDRYCVTCHNDKLKTAGLSLDILRLTDVPAHAEAWEKVIRKLRGGTMPPQGLPRPAAAASNALASWLETTVDSAAAARPNPGRTPALHRLNRAEYTNAIRDLLAVEIDGGALLPPDDSGYGFDNIADVLSVSPMLTERYLSAALKISRLAVGDPTIRPVTETFRISKYLKQEDRVSDDLPFGSRGGAAIRYYFPVDGDYVVKIFFDRTYDGRVRGLAEPHELEVRLDGAKVQQITVGGAEMARGGRNQAIDGTEVRFPATAGPKLLGVSFLKKSSQREGMLRPAYAVTSYEYAGDVNLPPAIGSLELRGPYDVRGPGASPSRERIFTCRANSEACARRILSALARRAYRRPVTDADIEPLLAFYHPARKIEGFDAGIEAALRRILVSPDFLFRVEQDPASAGPGDAYPVSDIELASRLSFFLWSSIPDDQLLDAAARGQLKQPAVLEQHVRRMLADPRSKALVANFAGQWLWVRNIRLHLPDPAIFPDFDENLRQALEREVHLFLESQIRDDHGVPELLTADYTFVNERLARHYGIPSVYGNHFRRITLADQARHGLLGKAGLLAVTSYPNRTSPVFRGKWLLENILGAPPPPPPPDVPALQENSAGPAALSVRQQMEQHRSNPACAACHKIMDPLGFALENFDAIGRWRTTDGVSTIDPSGVLADGSRVDGPAALRDALLSRREEFVVTVAGKLLTYAIGRGAEYYDAPAIRRIVRAAAADDYRWSSIILGITTSVPFQMRASGNRGIE